MKISTYILLGILLAGCAGVLLPTYSDYKTIEMASRPKPVSAPMPSPVPPGVEEQMRLPPNIVIPGSTSKWTDTDIDQQLFNTSMVFTVPYKANIDDQIVAEFIMDPKLSKEEIAKLAQDVTGQVITEDIQVSRTVTARLIAPNFKIDPDKEIRQAVSKTDPTKWTWFLTPTSEGTQTIQLRVVAHILIEGERVERELETFNRELIVEVTPEQKFFGFINDYLEFILGTLILPFLFWLVPYIISKFKKKDGDSDGT